MCNMSLKASMGGVAAYKLISLCVLNSLPTNRDRYSGFAASCLLTSIHLTPMGAFPVTLLHSSIGTFVYTSCCFKH